MRSVLASAFVSVRSSESMTGGSLSNMTCMSSQVVAASLWCEAYAGSALSSDHPGTFGMDGIAGNAGIDGISGDAGIDGMEGVAGIGGISGISGRAGNGDVAGMGGIAGIAGITGITGSSDGICGRLGAAARIN